MLDDGAGSSVTTRRGAPVAFVAAGRNARGCWRGGGDVVDGDARGPDPDLGVDLVPVGDVDVVEVAVD